MKTFVPMLVCGFSLLLPVSAAAADDYYTKENILKFAESLYAGGDYSLAAAEFLRAAALTENAGLRDSLWYRVASAYLYSGQPETARKFCRRIAPDSGGSLLVRKAGCMIAYSYYAEKKYDSAISESRSRQTVCNGNEWRERYIQISTAALLEQYRWGDALSEQGTITGAGREDTLTRCLRDLGLQGTQLRLKSPWTAAAFSAILPGSGKWYAHRGLDGLMSLLMIGTFAWQAYEGYRKDGMESVRFIGFGLLGSAFYAGNIYGSFTAARLYNQSQNSTIAGRVNIKFDW